MKKIALSLLLGLFTFIASAQTYQKFELTLKDNNGLLWAGSLQVNVQNSDSLNPNGFYKSMQTGNPTYRIIDSVLIPSGFTGTQITFGVPACGTVVVFDTILDPNITINHVMTLPCNLTCDAEFTFNINENGRVGMYSTDANSNHKWYIDGSLISTAQVTSYTLTGLANHLISHVIDNPGNNCHDSIVHSASLDSMCSADFSVNILGNDSVDFYPSILPGGRTAVLYFGDGSEYQFTSGSSSPIHYQYAQTNTYTAKIRVSAYGCADSSSKTINSGNMSCNAQFTMNYSNPYQWNIHRNDSSSGTATWTVTGLNYSNTYTGHSFVFNAPGAGYFQVKCDISISGTPSCFTTQSLNINNCGTSTFVSNYYGQVQFAGMTVSNYDSLIVYLIAYDSANATLTAMDSLVVYNQDSGWFNFTDCSNFPKTLFKAALLPGSGIYNSYLPTYGDSSVLWSGAREYGQSNLGPVIIRMKAGSNPGGPGFIGGYISQGANKHGAGLDDIQVTLFTDAGDPVAFTTSFNAGRYEFSNLALGKYQVLVEIPGKPSSIHYVTLDNDHKSADDLNFEVNSTYISTLNSVISIRPNLFKAYPNPAHESLVIEALSSENLTDLKVFSIQGVEQTVNYTVDGDQKITIDVQSLKAGVYLVQAGNDKVISILRFVKQ